VPSVLRGPGQCAIRTAVGEQAPPGQGLERGLGDDSHPNRELSRFAQVLQGLAGWCCDGVGGEAGR
jgi:hypothetical protein